MRAVISTAALFVAACDSAPQTQTPAPNPATFEITRDAFVAGFNRESASNQTGGLSACHPLGPAETSCRIVPLHRTEARAEALRLGVEIPGIEDNANQHVTLWERDGKLSRVMFAGDHRVYGAMQMLASLGSAAIVVGGDAARTEFTDGSTQVRFMDEVGLLHDAPPFGAQARASRRYFEVSCALTAAELTDYTCDVTPPIVVATTRAR